MRGDEPFSSLMAPHISVVNPTCVGMNRLLCARIGLGSRKPHMRGDEPVDALADEFAGP